jgi:hypothetical protein
VLLAENLAGLGVEGEPVTRLDCFVAYVAPVFVGQEVFALGPPGLQSVGLSRELEGASPIWVRSVESAASKWMMGMKSSVTSTTASWKRSLTG